MLKKPLRSYIYSDYIPASRKMIAPNWIPMVDLRLAILKKTCILKNTKSSKKSLRSTNISRIFEFRKNFEVVELHVGLEGLRGR